jgi:hypothetical protein
MRSPKLMAAVMAAAALLALAGAGAASARNHRPLNRRHGVQGAICQVSLSVAPRVITAGETTLATGQLTCPGGTAAGQTITVYDRQAGSPGYAVAGTAVTDPQGFYQLTTPALNNNTVFYAAGGGGVSRHRNVKVAAQVTLEGPAESKQLLEGLRTGRRNAVTFKGTVSPDDQGAEVILQRQNAVRGNEWHRIGHTVINGEGGFALTHIFRAPGDSSIRVLVRSNKRNVASPSNELDYVISQAQNPSLTIESSADPIAYGSSVVISGTVAGEANTTVTLLGHTTKNRFAAVAVTKTDATGKYTFAAQTPLLSTFYKVQSADRSSAVLYEGVKYILTDNAPVTSTPSGQAVTYTGSVTPAQAGHPVYLERQNLAGTGFHVVAVGTVAPTGEYSISRIFYAPGTDVLRIKVPGDPENGGTAGTPFDLTVTPLTSAAKLAPEPSTNSTLPPEGQV